MRIVLGSGNHTTKVGKNGYQYAYVPGKGWQLVHRLLIAQILERPLLRDEHIHHLNGDPTDNRIENLELIHIKDHGHLHSVQRWEHHELTFITCAICHKRVRILPYRKRTAVYCSTRCMGLGYRGKHYRTHT